MRTPLRPALASLAAALTALATSAPALATGGSVKVTGQAAGAYKFGRDACRAGTSVTFTWDLTAATPAYQSGTSLVVRAATTTDCAVNADRSDYSISSAASGTTQAIKLSDFLYGANTCANSSSTAANPGSAYFCVGYYTTATTTGTLPEVESVQLKYAMQPPSVPANVGVQSGDGLLRVTWAAGNSAEDIARYEIYVVEAPNAADGGSDAGADGGTDAGSADAGSADAGSSADPFDGLSPVTSPTSAATTLIQTTSTGAALVNGHSYLVRLRAIDSFSNVSDYTNAFSGTPTAIDDFYAYYQTQQGKALGGGGCGAAGAGWVAGLLLIGWLLARRRRGSAARAAGPLLVLALLGLTNAVRAEGAADPITADGAAPSGDRAGAAVTPAPTAAPATAANPVPIPVPRELERKPLRRGRSPRTSLFAIKVDRYDPKVDSEQALGGRTPYHDIFGTRVPLRVQLEADWQVIHPPWIGSLLAGLTAGFWQNIGRGRYIKQFTDSTGVVHNAGDRSDDTALLDIWPLGLIATWRFDALNDRFHWFPLIPYAQIGLTAALWASYNGAGNVSSGSATASPRGRGSGWTTGYTTALGVALALDAIDPGLSNEAYVDLGLQRTAFFAEYGWTRLDSFRSGSALILSDRQWRFGMSMEF